MNTQEIIARLKADVDKLKPETTIGEVEDGYYCAISDVLNILDTLEKECEEKPKKGLHSGSLRKVDNPMKWMEDDAKELTNPAVQEQPVDWQKIAEAHAKDQPLGQDNNGNLVYLQEQPVSEDVEMEIKETELEYQQRSERGEYPASIESIARHFYELGRQSKPKVCEGLEEEIKRWLKEGEITDTRYDDYGDNDIEATARHFAQWGAEHLKK